ncbi:SCO7613 C-terminal domain-containing membrane protein [Streptomyces sp. 7N604]|uniref:SCO7613 C-terminal domain-containing membrane protein n=1 Tax=Streptomyces sp. 7N604 TaxID=3457415 RepID=UPI003FD5AD5B
MDNVPPDLPPAVELQQLELTLARVEAQRSRLLARRAQLLAQLRRSGPASARAMAWAPRSGPPSPRRDSPRQDSPLPGSPLPFREADPPTVQNLLLTLGGVLLAIAVTAFTVVSWGHLGLGGRAAVLGALTLAAMGAPALLLRRALVATSEVVACLGLLLLVLDAYALHRVALPDADVAGYAAAASTVIAGTWAAYGLWLRHRPADGDGLHAFESEGTDQAPPDSGAPSGTRAAGLVLPLPIAVCLAQLPPVLWAVAEGAGPFGFGSALLASAVADLAIALWCRVPGVRLTAALTGSVTGAAGLLLATGLSVTASGTAEAGRAAALLLVGAAAGVSASWRFPALSAPSAPAAASAPAAPSTPVGAGEAGDSGAPIQPDRPPRTRPSGEHRPAGAAWPAAGGGLAVVAALGGLLRTGLPEQWTVLGYLLCGTGVLVAARALAGRAPVAAGLAAAAGAVHAGALLWTGPAVATAVLDPVSWVGAVWSGAPAGSREAITPAGTLGPEWSWPITFAVPTVLALTAVTALAVHRWQTGRHGRPALLPWAVVAGCAAGVVLPVALDLPYPVAVALLVAQTAVLLVASATLPEAAATPGPADPAPSRPAASAAQGSASPGRESPGRAPGSTDSDPTGCAAPAPPGHEASDPAARPTDPTGPAAHAAEGPPSPGRDAPGGASLAALLCAVAVAVTVGFWGLAEQAVTLAVFGSLLVVFGAAAASGGRVRQAVTACAAVVCAVALTVALCAAGDLPAARTAFAVLAVAAAASLLAARLRAVPAGISVESAGYAAALLAMGLAAGNRPVLTTVLALAGVIAAGTALRPDRRSAAHAAAALFVLATWVRLSASGVTAPEAYTLPVSVAALFVGVRRRRQEPSASSWATYGPGLAATLVPSLVAAWSDTHWLRPLLLGLGALAVTLLGARQQLQAPLLLGGAALALDALHELAPYIVQVVDALPRWLPPAVAGLLLLAVGATYEQRLRDARRVRDALGRMR